MNQPTLPHTKRERADLLEVRALGETLTVSSLDFAEGLGIQHKNLLSTIRTHLGAIEAEFGRVAFETPPLTTAGGKQQTKIVHLTEDQALFVGTLGRNSARVVAFKATLVRSFSEARRQLRDAAQLLMPADHLHQHDRRIYELEQQLKWLLLSQQQAATALLNLPRSAEPVPEEKTRAKVQRIVNAYCRAKSLHQQDVWRKVYDRLYYAYRVSIRKHKKLSERESWLDVAERCGHIDKIFAIVSQELTITP